jgi:hypothetical protein
VLKEYPPQADPNRATSTTSARWSDTGSAGALHIVVRTVSSSTRTWSSCRSGSSAGKVCADASERRYRKAAAMYLTDRLGISG